MTEANDYAQDPNGPKEPFEGEEPFSDPGEDTRALCLECVHGRHEQCAGKGCECLECADS